MHRTLIVLTILMTFMLTGYVAVAAQHDARVKLEAHRSHVAHVMASLR